MENILNSTYTFIFEQYQKSFKELTIKRVNFGVNLTYAELSDNSVGIASTLFEERMKPHKRNRDFGDFSPSKIKGQNVINLFESKKESNLLKSLKIAVLNAISGSLIRKNEYKVLENSDPIDLIQYGDGTKISMVGAFRSYIEKIGSSNADLKVLELNESIIPGKYKKYYIPAEDYASVIPQSDIVIITGLTLVNNTIDGLLDVINPGSKVIVVGPSANIIPDVLFQKGVDIIGATQYENTELLFDLISEGASAYHLFNYCAKKICILSE